MLRDELARRIDEISRDRTSGASELGIRAAGVLASAAAHELPETAAAIRTAQPAMASVHNAARAALRGRLSQFMEAVRSAQAEINRIAGELFASRCVLTHSRSSSVIAALLAAKPARVICTRSLPGGEGEATAAELRGDVIADAAIWKFMQSVQAVALGADAVTPYAVVNKVGTAVVALAARERGVPCFVLCGPEKMVEDEWEPEPGELFEATPREWFTRIVAPGMDAIG